MASWPADDSKDELDHSNKVQWVYEQDNEWINYDEETNEQIENSFQIAIKHKQKMKLVVPLRYGPKYSKPEYKKQYIVNIQVDATCDPPVIWKSVQTSKLDKKDLFLNMVVESRLNLVKDIPNEHYLIVFGFVHDMEKRLHESNDSSYYNMPDLVTLRILCFYYTEMHINITRFPSLDFESSSDIMDEIENYKCKYKWFWKSDPDHDDIKDQSSSAPDDNNNNDNNDANDGDELEFSDDEQEQNPWKEYDAITSAQIELCMNKQQKFTILNKSNFFKSPKIKNLYRVEFNHHCIPSEATQIEYISLRNTKKTEIIYEDINSSSKSASGLFSTYLMSHNIHT